MTSGIHIQAMENTRLNKKTKRWMETHEITFHQAKDVLSEAAKENLFDIMFEVLSDKKILFNYAPVKIEIYREISLKIANAINSIRSTNPTVNTLSLTKTGIFFLFACHRLRLSRKDKNNRQGLWKFL